MIRPCLIQCLCYVIALFVVAFMIFSKWDTFSGARLWRKQGRNKKKKKTWSNNCFYDYLEKLMRLIQQTHTVFVQFSIQYMTKTMGKILIYVLFMFYAVNPLFLDSEPCLLEIIYSLGKWKFPTLPEAWVYFNCCNECVGTALLKFFTTRPAAGRNCSSMLIIWIPLPSVASDTSLHNFYFSFFRKKKKKRRSWPPYHWLNNPVQSHSHLCRNWLVSSAGGRLSWWWTSSGEMTRLAECVRPGLVSEWHAKLDYWLLSRKRHKCLLK